MKSAHPSCPKCSASSFELRFLKDEGIATAKCLNCADDFLLLDSEDYWFDVIQKGYPRVSRCSCKSTAFDLRFDYELREDGDVKSVQVWTACSSCKKTKRQLSVDIDYGGTEKLLSHPLVYCKRPKLLYELRELTLYVKLADLARIADYLGRKAGCRFAAWIRRENKWVKEDADIERVKRAILSDKYFSIFASPSAMALPEAWTLREEASFWKRNEIIRISSPTHIVFGAERCLLFYVQFSNEFVEGEEVRHKSEAFRELTGRFMAWLGGEFVSWRGPLCFDDQKEHLRIFGDRFTSKGRIK